LPEPYTVNRQLESFKWVIFTSVKIWLN
jgi:hypothetical protein